MIKEEHICHLCGTSESEEILYKVNEPDSECHGLWLCLACYVDELAEEPNENTQNTEDDDDEDMYEPEYEPDYDDMDDMDDDDIDDMLKEMFRE